MQSATSKASLRSLVMAKLSSAGRVSRWAQAFRHCPGLPVTGLLTCPCTCPFTRMSNIGARLEKKTDRGAGWGGRAHGMGYRVLPCGWGRQRAVSMQTSRWVLAGSQYSGGENRGSERLTRPKRVLESRCVCFLSPVANGEPQCAREGKRLTVGRPREPASGHGRLLLPEPGCEHGGPSQGNSERKSDSLRSRLPRSKLAGSGGIWWHLAHPEVRDVWRNKTQGRGNAHSIRPIASCASVTVKSSASANFLELN